MSAGVFHAFHVAWIGELQKALNGGILPEGYYALAEQVAGKTGPDVLTLQTRGTGMAGSEAAPNGGTAVKKKPPKVRFTSVADETEIYALKRRTLVIRHASEDDVIALLEILSPGNKSHQRALQRFLDKAVSALTSNIHLLIVDLHPPGPHDPQGIHGVFWSEFASTTSPMPRDKPLTLAAYSAGAAPRAYVEPIAVGSTMPEMPLFLDEDAYVDVPLEDTYREAYRGVPDRWRAVLEGRKTPGGPAV